jgi:uncharacterized membrane protein
VRPLRLLSWTLLAILLLLAAVSYAGLPDRIPEKLAIDGRVTRDAAKTVWRWFLLPGIALVLQLLFEGIGAMLPSRPQWFNFPEKERFLALPREFQAPVIAEMRTLLDIALFGIQLLFLVIQYQLWAAAQGRGTSGLIIAAAVLPVLLTPMTLFWLTRVTSALEREEARYRDTRQRGQPA